jgi:transcriptional regulator with XRE-family HTH domain
MRAPEPLLRDVVGRILRGERTDQGRTLRDVAAAAGISMPYLSEVERGRKEASSEILAAVAGALGLRLLDVIGRAQWELSRMAGNTLTSISTPISTQVQRPGTGSVSLLAA